MKKIVCYMLTFLSITLAGCSREDQHPESEGAVIKLAVPKAFLTKVVDGDNLAVEQTVNNISLFFAEPSATTITFKYVNTGFTTSGDYQIISLPVEPQDLQTKNIYVVANYDDEEALNALATIDDLKTMITPEVDKTNNLDPENGFCMYGSTLNFDFTAGSDAIVDLVRTCAKIRVNLTFPENPGLSTSNSFLIQNAARYTYIIKNSTAMLPLTDYFNFAAPINLVDNGADAYVNNAYIYEATALPVITIYTHINNSTEQQEFTANLPLPQRNYLYDLQIEIYEEETASRSTESIIKPSYRAVSTLRVYDEKGEPVQEF
ncbi:MAG: hypothetical protein LUH10_12925 [Tannerellaceae bacterium]|nr:hypothetical protein [Tannerellaceae bacterium]